MIEEILQLHICIRELGSFNDVFLRCIISSASLLLKIVRTYPDTKMTPGCIWLISCFSSPYYRLCMSSNKIFLFFLGLSL